MEHGGAAAASAMHECAAHAARIARISWSVEQKRKIVAESQRVHELNMPRARSASVEQHNQSCGISDRQFAVACGARI
jgi:hypothetical protein